LDAAGVFGFFAVAEFVEDAGEGARHFVCIRRGRCGAWRRRCGCAEEVRWRSAAR
jgi:hypothetical protein